VVYYILTGSTIIRVNTWHTNNNKTAKKLLNLLKEKEFDLCLAKRFPNSMFYTDFVGFKIALWTGANATDVQVCLQQPFELSETVTLT